MSVQKHESHNKGSKRKTITIINSIVNFAENLEKSLSRPSLFEFNSNSKKAFDDLDIYYIKSDNIYSLKTSLGSINLKPHQETSLYYMMGLEQQIYTVSYTNNKKIKTDIELLSDTCELETLHYTNIGLLCDKVGAGKTYTILSLIKEQKSLELVNMVTRDCNSGSSIINVVEPRKKLNTNILLVPHGLVAQWEDCCKKTNVKYYTISKAQDVYNLGENCLFAKHKSEPLKKSKSKPKSTIINPDEINVVPIETSSTKKKISIVRKKKSTVEDTIEPMVIVNSDDPYNILLQQKEELQKTIEANEQNMKILQEELDQYINQNNILKTLIMSCAQKYNKTIDPYYINIGSYYLYTIFSNVVSDPKEYQNIKNIIDSIVELNRKISDINAKKKKLHELIKEQLKNISGKVSEYDITKINENYENVYYQEYLNFLGHINKKFVENYDIIIVSENFYNLFCLFINKDKYIVNRIIVDECNSIKGTNLIKINSVFTWLVSSSVNSLVSKGGWSYRDNSNSNGTSYKGRYKCVNSTGFILDILKELYDNISENYKLFLINDPEYIEQSMTLPESINSIIACKDNQTIRILNGLVSYDIMKMLNAGDVTGIVSKLECQSGTENDIVTLITQKYEDDLKLKEYALQMALGKPNYDPKNETEGTKNLRIVIKDLKEKIANIKSRVTDNEECSICYDETFTNPCITSCCSQKFCFPCITLALNSNGLCPNCNQSQSPKDLVLIGEMKISKEVNQKIDINKHIRNSEKAFTERLELLKNDSENCSKYDNISRIFSLISTEEKRKILIFTEYESTLNEKMAGILTAAGLKYGRLKGTSDTIKKVIDSYRNGDVNVLMINSVYFGSGTNLENTTDIIIIHKMPSDIEMQVIGRAQRFGRVGNLRIWKLYYQNEI